MLLAQKAWRTTLNAIWQAIAAERWSPVWTWIFTFLVLMLIILAFVVAGYFVVMRYFLSLKARILKYLMQMLPDSVLGLIMPATPATATAAAAAAATDSA
jgi:hypothetical protein